MQLRKDLKKIHHFNRVSSCDLTILVQYSNQLSYEAIDVGSWSIVGPYVPGIEMNVSVVYEVNHVRTVEMKSNEA